ncbi:hypothetical protein BN1723_020565, partial [Verticillium longisporum]
QRPRAPRRRDQVHQRHALLAGQLVPPPLPEQHHVLEVGRQGRQDLRRGRPQRQRPAVVERVLRPRDSRPRQRLPPSHSVLRRERHGPARRGHPLQGLALLD